MSDPQSYPQDTGPFHPDEVDGVDEGISELNDAADTSDGERDDEAEPLTLGAETNIDPDMSPE
nr:hypothetical protein [uncultured Microbacterium sp.]